MAMVQNEYKSGLQINALSLKNTLRIVNADEFERLDKIKQVMTQKEAALA